MIRMADFLETEKNTSREEFVKRFPHGFILINKTPTEDESKEARSFQTRDADQAKEQIIRSQGDAELHPVVSSTPSVTRPSRSGCAQA